jgi:hypothetical protein
MPWCVNEDGPDWTTIHRTTSTDPRCQPQEKRAQDGQWHTCQTEQELLDLLPIIVGGSGPQVRACGICRPLLPAAVQPFITG